MPELLRQASAASLLRAMGTAEGDPTGHESDRNVSVRAPEPGPIGVIRPASGGSSRPDGARALTIVAGRELVEPVELDLVSVAEAEGELFTRWRVRRK